MFLSWNPQEKFVWAWDMRDPSETELTHGVRNTKGLPHGSDDCWVHTQKCSRITTWYYWMQRQRQKQKETCTVNTHTHSCTHPSVFERDWDINHTSARCSDKKWVCERETEGERMCVCTYYVCVCVCCGKRLRWGAVESLFNTRH